MGRECGRAENTLIEMVQLLSGPAPSRRVLMERGLVFARVSDSSRQSEIQIFCVSVLPWEKLLLIKNENKRGGKKSMMPLIKDICMHNVTHRILIGSFSWKRMCRSGRMQPDHQTQECTSPCSYTAPAFDYITNVFDESNPILQKYMKWKVALLFPSVPLSTVLSQFRSLLSWPFVKFLLLRDIYKIT